MEWPFFTAFSGMVLFFLGIMPALSTFAQELRRRHFEQYTRLNFPEFPNNWKVLWGLFSLGGGSYKYSEHEMNGLKTMLAYIGNGEYKALKDRRLINRGDWIRFWMFVVVGLLSMPILLVFTLFGD